MSGKQIGKYQLVAEIARGGMGVVYLALAQGPARFNKLHVVKELKRELGEDAQFVEMFLEEARLAARLNHPNIVQTHEVGLADGRYHLVMDYLEGAALSKVTSKKSADFTLGMKLRVVTEVLRALDYAHTLVDLDGTPLRLIHRDVTPQNVFLTFDGHVKLMDFGIAKALDSTIETQAGMLKGKPAYMAPEQYTGHSDSRADIFSAGVVLWELVVGRRMWDGKSQVEIFTAVLKDEIPSIAQVAPSTPEGLVAIIDKATKKDPDARYSTAAEFLDALERYMHESRHDGSTRDIGKMMNVLFAENRKRIQEIIERHLQRTSAGFDDTLPSLPPPGHATSSLSRRSMYPPRASITGLTGTGTGTPGAAEISIPLASPTSRLRGSILRYGAFGLLAGAGVTTAILFARREDRASAAAVAPPPPVESAAPTPKAAAPSAQPSGPLEHEVVVNALPKSALISMDGEAMANPARRTCKHGERFVIHITAPGHVARDREVRCEYDEHLDITLAATAQTIVINQTPPAMARPAPKPDPLAEVPNAPPATTPARHAAPLDTNPFR